MKHKPRHEALPSSDIIGAEKGPVAPRGGLYIHWPFCETKCRYCDFYSVALRGPPGHGSPGGSPVGRVLDAVGRELRWRFNRPEISICTVFLGGGTPTTLDPAPLRHLLEHIGSAVAGHAVSEFTVEANPATVDQAKADALSEAGVNRVSLGAQSFCAAELAFLERLHGPEDIPQAVATIRHAGITNYNLDLVFGITGQSLASWRDTIHRALELEPTHLACYGLTYEHGTPLTRQLERGEVARCDESLEGDLYLAAVETLEAAGYEHYEISNFARPGRSCRHNLNYWCNGPYLSVGPSAVGFTNGRRYRNAADVAEYTRRVREDGHAVVEEEMLDGPAAALESLMMQLRLVHGVDLQGFCACTGIDLLESCADSVRCMCKQRLLETVDGHLRLTREGLLVADAVIAELGGALADRSGAPLPLTHTATAPGPTP